MQLVDDGRLFGAFRMWYQGDPASSGVAVKPYEMALAEARLSLVNAEAYELGDWSWGYKELVDGAGQAEMSLVYEFAFVPRKTVERTGDSPQLVEVSATAAH